jgi:hypothetical protein
MLVKKLHTLIFIFLLFFIFSIIGSNIYLFNTWLSFRNILFFGLLVIIFALRKVKITNNQILIGIPIFLLFALGVMHFIFYFKFEIEVFKDFFYFTFIPVQFLVIILLGNKFNWDFFKTMFNLSFNLLVLLFLITIFEFFTNIHFRSHNSSENLIPSGFFTNSNDLSVVAISLLMLLMAFSRTYSNSKKDIVITLFSGIIVFITLSRISIIAYFILVFFKFASKINTNKLVILIVPIASLLIIISQIKLPSKSNSIIERSIIRINSLNNLESQFNNKKSSLAIRYDIYKIPFNNPSYFITGCGFNSDKKIIEKFSSSSHKIINSHSFFIQLIFYFGWLGFAILSLFFLMLFLISALKSNYTFLLIIFSQALIINIPSSIMRMPIVWIPFFIIISFYTYNRKISVDQLNRIDNL